jgi:hypothetical protein
VTGPAKGPPHVQHSIGSLFPHSGRRSDGSDRTDLFSHGRHNEQQLSTLRFKREVADRFGLLPHFFCSADAAPGLAEELWKFAKSAYLDNPLPSLFKERLFVHLSRFCEIRYCIVRHIGFLIGQGRSAGYADAGPETITQVIELLRRPLPEGPALATILERLECVSFGGRMPEPRTESEADLFDALTIMFLSPRGAARARAAVRAAVGDTTFELLVGQKQDKEQATRAGFDAHLTKPADGAALAGIVASRASRDGQEVRETRPHEISGFSSAPR